MASSGNFAILNTLIRPVGGTSRTTSNGNTTISSSSGSWGAPLTLAANTGKWYCEFYVNAGSSGRNVGIVPTNSPKYNDGDYSQGGSGDYAITLNSGGSIYNNGSVTQTVASNMATGDIMGVAMNLDASPKTVQFYKNGSTIGSAENINSSATGPYTFMTKGHNQTTITMNAGQDSSFSGAKTSGSANAADDNGFGDFYYTPPSGFLSVTSANLPISDDIDPAQTNSNYPSEQFGVVKNTGTGSATTVTGLGMQPDLIWAKRTDGSRRHYIVDSVRGFTKYLHPEGSYSEGTSSDGITSANSDGFAIGGSLDYINTSSSNYISWCWRGNGGTTASNSDGNVTTTISANPEAGFSIVSWTGTGTNSRTLGTGLTKEVEWFMVKNRDSGSYPFICYHHQAKSGGQPNDYGILNMSTTGGYNEGSGSLTYWDISEFSSSVFSVGGDPGVNGSGNNMIAYCWHGVEGYSKFGSYTANGNADGPFIYTVFKPKMVMIKGTVSGAAWIIRDDTLDGYNPGLGVLQPNSDAAKYTSAGGVVNILSNGFKVTTANAVANSTSYDPYVYMAWGDVPFKYNNTF